MNCFKVDNIMKYISIIVLSFVIFINVHAPSNANISVVNGVSLELAQHRKKTISNINYNIELNISALHKVPIKATSEIIFDLNDLDEDLQIDFAENAQKIKTIRVNGKRRSLNHKNEHIIVNKNHLRRGTNKVKIVYTAGDGALNRSPNFLYTLFVPDRMRTSFPSFDQPNLKATFDLTLKIPSSWESMSSAPVRRETSRNLRKTIWYKTSDKMSTYLFSFVAGRFKKIVAEVDGFEMTMLHREPDEDKVRVNVDEIFKLHKASIDYLEEYTGIKYPFQKFGFVLIPSFQFGGMEHVGAIQYKDSTIILDETPSATDRLSRAALIGHETAHMWFGDLVTMDWFNDVWTKEVFANFMSAKLVNPSFPEINHQLRSHLRLHPGAYRVDRSEGPNPIRQDLLNLNEAGTMYGAIIYNKAPIMMGQLEALLGEEKFRDGIREYLSTYAHSNATWPDLINILDKHSDQDLVAWSEIWVNSPGRPVFEIENLEGQGLLLSQSDPRALDRKWPQNFKLKKGNVPHDISFSETAINLNDLGNSIEEKILVNADGMGYGLFPIEKNFLKSNWDNLSDLERAAALVNLYEQLMEGNRIITPLEYVDLINWIVQREKNPLIINHTMRQLVTIFWSMLNQPQRMSVASNIEEAIWQQVNSSDHTTGIKRIYFRNYVNLALTDGGIANVKSVWNQELKVKDLNLATRDYTNMAASLAIKIPAEAHQIIRAQRPRINGPDNQARFEFIQHALAPDQETRDKFFDALTYEENRHTEPWVLTALGYLHHPLRAGASEKYLKQSLEILQEIQITGDIFFPGRWLSANYKYYQSDSAVETVRNFLVENPDYNYQLRLKILQEADQMFRANKILNQEP